MRPFLEIGHLHQHFHLFLSTIQRERIGNNSTEAVFEDHNYVEICTFFATALYTLAADQPERTTPVGQDDLYDQVPDHDDDNAQAQLTTQFH